MSSTHDHAVRGRFHAWFLSATENAMHRIYGERKKKLFDTIPPEVVEIGPGTGANFRYYPTGTRVVAIEPNVRMHGRLSNNARRHDLQVEILGLQGEGLDLPDSSAELVVCTMVLCSVEDPVRVISEIRRVLTPGGRFVFLEHVAAPEGSTLRRLQNALDRPWSWCFEGCHPNRETWKILHDAGFASVELEHFRLMTPLIHTAPQLAGVAIK